MESTGSDSRRIIKVLFGVPNEGHTASRAYDNRMEMCTHLGVLQTLSSLGLQTYCDRVYDIPDGVEYQFNIGVVGETFPALARERLVDIALEGEMDYLFMIDDDMLVPADTFELLIKNDVDICAALAFTRHDPHKPVIYNLSGGYDELVKKSYYVNQPVITYPKEKLVQCDAVGFGGVLIKMEVFKKMERPWFMCTSGAGEDINFCHKAGEAGFKIYMDTRIKLGHLGYHKLITEATYEEEANIEELRKEYGDYEKYSD